MISLIKRREDLTLDEFRAWALERHAPKGRADRVRLVTREARFV